MNTAIRSTMILLVTLVLASVTSSQTSSIIWSAFGSGFGVSYGSGTQVTSLVGQPIVGQQHSGSGIIVNSGFLAGKVFSPILDVEPPAEIAREFKLMQNFPNPFNPTTVIRYSLPVAGQVSLTVYNILGQRAAVLVDHRQEAGNHEVVFDAAALPSGVYFYKLQAGSFVASRKLLLVR